MKIGYEKTPLTKRERVSLLTGSLQSMKEIPDGTHLHVDNVVVYEQEGVDGAPIQIVALNSEGTWYVTSSRTFQRTLLAIDDCMTGETYEIEKISGTSRQGRTYIDCRLI